MVTNFGPYLYAGLDFMLDSELNLVFLEANAVPGGIYVMDRANNLLLDNKPSFRDKLIGINLVEKLVLNSVEYYSKIRNTLPKFIVITTPLVGGLELMPERTKIMSKFQQLGFHATIVNRNKYLIKNNTLYVKLGSRLLKPDLIIRRNTDFPKNLNQIIINRSEVGIITGSKIRTYNVVSRYIGKTPTFRIPKTYYAKEKKDIFKYATKLLKEKKYVIIKPNRGEKGKGIYLVRDTNSINSLIHNLPDNTSYLIQEKIEPYYIRGSEGKFIFDIRAYVFFGKFVGAHIRRAKNPVGIGSWDDWGISNIASGGRYVPLLIDSIIDTIRWNKKPLPLKPFKSIIVDKYALVIDTKILRNLVEASEMIVNAINEALQKEYGIG